MENLIPIKNLLLLSGLFFASLTPLAAQDKYPWQKDIPGQLIYKYNIQAGDADEALFKKNITEISEWFHQNIPLLNKPMGFNMDVYVSRGWEDYHRISPANYGLTADIRFSFQLFGKNGAVWKAELPTASYYNFNVNRLARSGGWVGSIGQFDYFNNTKHDPKLEKAIDKAASKLDEMMTIFPLIKEIAPGVHAYENGLGSQHIVVFNPKRPPYLIPVTIRELTQAYLNYYSQFQTLEIDRMLMQELKKEIAAFTEKELNGPAYAGHPSNIVFRQSADNRNLPIMRLNPEYWDKSLPPSAIQLMVFHYPQMPEEEMKRYLERFGYPVNSQILVNQINWEKVAGLIMKGK